MTTRTTNGSGLRERKKAETRSRLVDAAQALFEKKGFDATTIEEIANAADVAPRTFFRYFSTKEDLVFLGQDEENRQVGEWLRQRPPTQTALEFLLEATRRILDASAGTFEQARRSRKLVRSTPALRDYQRGLLADVEELLVEGLTPPRASRAEALRIRLLVAVHLAASSTVMNARLEADGRAARGGQLELVEDVLRNGFAEGPSRRIRRRT